MLTGTSLCLLPTCGVCVAALWVWELWELLSGQELKEGAQQHRGTHGHFRISPVYHASSLPREVREGHKELLSSPDPDHEEMLPSPQSGLCACSDGDGLHQAAWPSWSSQLGFLLNQSPQKLMGSINQAWVSAQSPNTPRFCK